MWNNTEVTVDLFTVTKETFNGKNLFCAVLVHIFMNSVSELFSYWPNKTVTSYIQKQSFIGVPQNSQSEKFCKTQLLACNVTEKDIPAHVLACDLLEICWNSFLKNTPGRLLYMFFIWYSYHLREGLNNIHFRLYMSTSQELRLFFFWRQIPL